MNSSADCGLDSIVVFRLGLQLFAMPVAAVREVVPIAWLAKPIQMPSVVEGILNLGGVAVPILKLDRLLGTDESRIGLDASLLIMRGDTPFGLLVDRVEFVRRADHFSMAGISGSQSFNGCVIGTLAREGGDDIHLLSWERLLVEEESVRLADFQVRAQSRLAELVEVAP